MRGADDQSPGLTGVVQGHTWRLQASTIKPCGSVSGVCCSSGCPPGYWMGILTQVLGGGAAYARPAMAACDDLSATAARQIPHLTSAWSSLNRGGGSTFPADRGSSLVGQ